MLDINLFREGELRRTVRTCWDIRSARAVHVMLTFLPS
jgi:hypothetical protein